MVYLRVMFLLLILSLSACTLPNSASSPADDVVVPTLSSRNTLAAVATPIVLPTWTARSAASDPGYPAPQEFPNAYPAPQVFPTSYPEPLPQATPTETPTPFPAVATLPFDATWFVKPGSGPWGCGNILYARSADGDIVELDQRVAAWIYRPNMVPLLITCTVDESGYRWSDTQLVDLATGSSLSLPLDTVENNYDVGNGILSADGQYYVFRGRPDRSIELSDPNWFFGFYRLDVHTGEVVPMIQFSSNEEGDYDEAGVVWDLHWPTTWNENEMTVFTMASMDTNLWKFTWDEDALLPYSVAAGTLMVESLDDNPPWPTSTPPILYEEPSLPAYLVGAMVVYSPTP